jgi:hypothetical protein
MNELAQISKQKPDARDNKYATAINCMDGRVQFPVTEWLKYRFSVDYVDRITEPGPVRVLAEDLFQPAIDLIRNKVFSSIRFHNSDTPQKPGCFYSKVKRRTKY